VQGGKIHSSDEFMFVSSLTERVALNALILMKLADGALNAHLHSKGRAR
jgi:glutamate carboxypeptidase